MMEYQCDGVTTVDLKLTSHMLKQETLVCAYSYELSESKKKKTV